MAEDHRYSWLDDSAVERLLRGEPVEGQPGAPGGRDGQSYAEAERLAAVLSAVAGAGRPAAPSGASPLPGEDAAVAAFRAARAEAQADAVAGMDAARHPHRGRLLGRRQPRLRRPLRAGMVAAVAGCALSGFAVAAAAGVLPTPFGQGDDTPGPSSSMSETGPGGESVRPEISEDGVSTSPAPSGSGDNDASDVGTSGDQGGSASSGAPDDDTGAGQGEHGRANDPSSGGSSKGIPGVPAWALDVCRQYLASESGGGAELDKKSLKKLARAAGGMSAINGYCGRVLGADGTGTPRTDNGSNGNGNGNGGNGNGNGNGNGGNGNGNGGGDTGADGGGDTGNDGGGGGSDPLPPPPPADDTTGTPGDTTPSTPGDSVTSTDPTAPTGSPASGDPATVAETSAD
ncbi:hypothetical protein [Streptomyces demainii]|uniref:Extensin n=1 Tax=Streptomyces demainii TaxID=588122 RepID=A0ABT9KLR4_9ACTN|nr:hypothetical protein [Streptomyces demainii]MDP9609375.1 hypothetical protein [Streptomyces demainii]